MNFQETYTRMNDALLPSPALTERTLKRAGRRRPWRRLVTIAAAAVLLLATPALAVRTEAGYELLYQLSPSIAQFFQPVRESCTDQGVTMEVVGVRVADDTAQAWITLTGGSVDETTDLFDSYSFHLPFDQSGHCEYLGWDEVSQTVTFLCTIQTMDGSPIPTGSKMTFSVRQLLTGKETLEDAAVELALADFTQEAETVPAQAPEEQTAGGNLSENVFLPTGGDGASDLMDSVPMLLPGPVLTEPAKGLSVTAAGYADGLFHVQLCRGDATRLDNHANLWLEDTDGAKREAATVYFTGEIQGERVDYIDFIFDVPPEDLPSYTLHGDFYTASALTEGLWQVTFPLKNQF